MNGIMTLKIPRPWLAIVFLLLLLMARENAFGQIGPYWELPASKEELGDSLRTRPDTSEVNDSLRAKVDTTRFKADSAAVYDILALKATLSQAQAVAGDSARNAAGDSAQAALAAAQGYMPDSSVAVFAREIAKYMRIAGADSTVVDSMLHLLNGLLVTGTAQVDSLILGVLNFPNTDSDSGKVLSTLGNGKLAWKTDDVDTSGTAGIIDSLATASMAQDTTLAARIDSVRDNVSGGGGGGLAAVTIGGTGSGATFEVATAGDGDSVLQAAYDSVASLRPGHRTIGLLTDTLTVDDTVYVQAPYSTLVGYGNRIHIVGNIAAIIDTGGFDSWGFDGVTFIGDASAYAAFGGDNETDSVFFKNGRIEGFTGAGTRGVVSDSLSTGWQFTDNTFVGNTRLFHEGGRSTFRGNTFREHVIVGLCVNNVGLVCTGNSFYEIGDTCIAAKQLGGGLFHPTTGPLSYGCGDACQIDGNYIYWADTSSVHVGIYASQIAGSSISGNTLFGGRVMFSGTVRDQRIGQGLGIYLQPITDATYQYGVSIAGNSVSSFGVGIHSRGSATAITGGSVDFCTVGVQSYHSFVLGVMASMCATGFTTVTSGYNAWIGCTAAYCVTGLNIANGTKNAYANFIAFDCTSNVTDGATNTIVGPTAEIIDQY